MLCSRQGAEGFPTLSWLHVSRRGAVSLLGDKQQLGNQLVSFSRDLDGSEKSLPVGGSEATGRGRVWVARWKSGGTQWLEGKGKCPSISAKPYFLDQELGHKC